MSTSAAMAHRKALADALEHFARYCRVDVTSQQLTDAYELTQPTGQQLRMEFRHKGSIETSASLVGVWTDLRCREETKTRKGSQYRVWTLISAPMAGNELNCEAWAVVAKEAAEQ